MCGRYFIDFETEKAICELLQQMDRDMRAERLGLRSTDVVPSDTAPILVDAGGHLEVERQRWGFPGVGGKGLVINARAETVLEKKMFHDAVISRRAVVPASRFYEWNKNRDRITFLREDREVLFMAGFYSRFEDGNHYVILTTKANDSMACTHDRMPLLLEKDAVEDWVFNGSRLKEYLLKEPAPLAKEAEYEQISLPGL